MKDKNVDIEIRQEQACDFPIVYNINLEAFGRNDEAHLVDRMRTSEAFIPELSLVAISEGRVVGYIMFSKVSIINGVQTQESLSLAPMAVSLQMQGRGIGTLLVNYGLEKASQLGYKSVIVLGHSDYYPRFGFVPTTRWGIKPPFNAPDNAFMAKELVSGSLSNISGTVVYAREFQGL